MATAKPHNMRDSRRALTFTQRQCKSPAPKQSLAQHYESTFLEELKLMGLSKQEFAVASKANLTEESLKLSSQMRALETAERQFRHALGDPELASHQPRMKAREVWHQEPPSQMKPSIDRLLNEYQKILGNEYEPERALASAKTVAKQVELRRQKTHDLLHPEVVALRGSQHAGRLKALTPHQDIN